MDVGEKRTRSEKETESPAYMSEELAAAAYTNVALSYIATLRRFHDTGPYCFNAEPSSTPLRGCLVSADAVFSETDQLSALELCHHFLKNEDTVYTTPLNALFSMRTHCGSYLYLDDDMPVPISPKEAGDNEDLVELSTTGTKTLLMSYAIKAFHNRFPDPRLRDMLSTLAPSASRVCSAWHTDVGRHPAESIGVGRTQPLSPFDRFVLNEMKRPFNSADPALTRARKLVFASAAWKLAVLRRLRGLTPSAAAAAHAACGFGISMAFPTAELIGEATHAGAHVSSSASGSQDFPEASAAHNAETTALFGREADELLVRGVLDYATRREATSDVRVTLFHQGGGKKADFYRSVRFCVYDMPFRCIVATPLNSASAAMCAEKSETFSVFPQPCVYTLTSRAPLVENDDTPDAEQWDATAVVRAGDASFSVSLEPGQAKPVYPAEINEEGMAVLESVFFNARPLERVTACPVFQKWAGLAHVRIAFVGFDEKVRNTPLEKRATRVLLPVVRKVK